MAARIASGSGTRQEPSEEQRSSGEPGTHGDAPEVATIDLGPELTVVQAAAVYSRLRDTLEKRQTVSVNVGSVETVDAAGLQLFTAFMREAATKQLDVRLDEPGDAFRTALDRLGLGSVLATRAGDSPA